MFALLRRLTEASTHRPKATLACVFVGIMALSSGAQHLVFDSSEDGFFPTIQASTCSTKLRTNTVQLWISSA